MEETTDEIISDIFQETVNYLSIRKNLAKVQSAMIFFLSNLTFFFLLMSYIYLT